MRSKLTEEQRLQIINEHHKGRKVVDLCREWGISRVLFYKLLCRYRLDSSGSLGPRVAKPLRYARQVTPRVEQLVLRAVATCPEKSVGALYAYLASSGIGRHAIQNILERNNLNTRLARVQFSGASQARLRANPSGLTPEDRKTMFDMVKTGKNISEIYKQFGISRVTFYKLYKRYKDSGFDLGSLVDRKRKIERWGRQASPEVEGKIRQIVIDDPDLSSHKISKVLQTISGAYVLGNHGIHNVLKRLNLNTFSKRSLFAQSYAVGRRVEVAPLYIPEMPVYRWRQLFAPFATVPKLILVDPRRGIPELFVLSTPFLALFFFIHTVSSAAGGTSVVGLAFASIALCIGLFFFVYSMSYYISIFMVLRVAQSGGNKS